MNFYLSGLCLQPPDPYITGKWKAETLHFLYVLLLAWGVEVISLLIMLTQSYCFVLEYSF